MTLRTEVGEPFVVQRGREPLVTTAIHTGHEVRPSIAEHLVLDEATRLREEDPYTDRIAGPEGTAVVVHRSRFEIDLNRPRDHAVYVEPEDAWGLDLWDGDLPPWEVDESLRTYDDFYETLQSVMDPLAARGRFLVLDLHSYNHRRGGAEAPPSAERENPEVNVGTGPLDRNHWAPEIERFEEALREQVVAGHRVDVRENVRFRGGHLSHWVADHYPDEALVLAVEFKKTFMDEWTGEYDERHLDELRDALATAVRPLV